MQIEHSDLRIHEYLSDSQRNMLELLGQLVLIETPSDLPESQAAAFALLSETLESCDFRVEHLPGRTSGGTLLAHAGRSSNHSKQLLIGHTDTVWPLGTLSRMPLETDANRLHGPGVYDMKAGLVQIVFALQALHRLELTPQVAPVVLINSDEELGSPDSESHILEWAHQSNRAWILEPGFGHTGKIKTARKGIGNFVIRVKGKAAHAGLEPEAGISAILELSHIIQNLHSLNDPLRGISVNVGVIEGGIRPNVVAPESRAIVDVRVLYREDALEIERAVRSLKPVTEGAEILVEGGISRPPLEKTSRNRRLWLMAQQVGGKLGLELEEATAGGCSDGNLTSQVTATLDGLGAVGDGAHAVHEFIYLDRMVERTTLLAHLLLAPPI